MDETKDTFKVGPLPVDGREVEMRYLSSRDESRLLNNDLGFLACGKCGFEEPRSVFKQRNQTSIRDECPKCGNFLTNTFSSLHPKKVTIAKIEKGVVIDHIPAGKAFLISKVLGLSRLAQESGDIIAIGVNFESPTVGKKDVIKVENLSLTRDMLKVVALIAPQATVTRIESGKVLEKHRAEVPSDIGDVVICPDSFCITRHEEVPGKFKVIKSDPLVLRCHYCETSFYGLLIRYKEQSR